MSKPIKAESATQKLRDLKVKVIDGIERLVKKHGEHRLSPSDERFDQLDLCEAGVAVNLTADNGDGEDARFQVQMMVVTDQKPHGDMTIFVQPVEEDGVATGETETWGEEELLALDCDSLITVLKALEGMT